MYQQVKEGFRGLLTNRIFIRKFYALESLPENVDGFLVSMALKLSATPFEVDENLTSEVRKGMRGKNYSDCVSGMLSTKEIELQKSSAVIPVWSIADCLNELLTTISDNPNNYYHQESVLAHDYLASLEVGLDPDSNFFEGYPSILDFYVFTVLHKIMKNTSGYVRVLMNDHHMLRNYFFNMEKYAKQL